MQRNMSNISDNNGSSSIRESSKTGHTSNKPSSSGRRLRSSTRLRTINDNRKDNSLSSSFIMESARLSDTNIMDYATNDATLTTTTPNIQDKVALFMDTIRIAMKTLMQDHGYSRERAKISLLDQLVSLTYTSTTIRQPETKRMDTVLRSPRNAVEVSTTSIPLSHAPTLAISDEKLFNYMRKKNIGMEHATIALTIEQAISSMLNDPNSSYSSISEILDTWIQYLQNVQPKPLTHLTLKSSSAFGSPLFHIPTMTPIAAQQQPEPNPSIKTSTIQQQSKNPPCTPVSNMDPTANGKPISSHTRSRAGGKKSNKTAMATPPLSTITIATTSSSSTSSSTQQQRSRSDSVTEAVSAKMTLSTSAIDGESNQHIAPASRGKPPLAPNSNSISAASGAGSVTATSLNTSSNNNKRTNMDSAARLEHPQESSSGGRPASPSSLTLPSSNKRQRRSTSMSSDN